MPLPLDWDNDQAVGNSSIIVEVWDTELGLRQEYHFEKTPVRIGRSPLNDLPLERPFVSHCHGVLHADGAQCSFVDLGSTNGTCLKDVRLAKHQPTPLLPSDCLQIGTLELRVRKTAPGAPSSHASYAFHPSQLNVTVPPELARVAEARAVVGMPGQPAPTDRLAALYERYRTAWSELMGALRDELPQGSSAAQRVPELLGRFPELAQEVEFRRWLQTDRVSPSSPPASAGGAQEREQLSALLRVPAHYGRSPQFPERLALVLERFAQSFIELRRGQRQFAKEAALWSTREPLEKFESAQALLAYLLVPDAPPSRVEELNRAFADAMVHQMALLNGFAAGARELLEELSPRALARRHAGPWRTLLRLVGIDARWNALLRRHADLAEESALSAVLTGKSFARAYAAVMGGAHDLKANSHYDTEPV